MVVCDDGNSLRFFGRKSPSLKPVCGLTPSDLLPENPSTRTVRNWLRMPAGRSPRCAESGFTEEQIIGILKEAEAGAKTTDLCRRNGLSE